MMTPKDLLDTMLGYLGFVVEIQETTNEGGNATLQIYTEESRRIIGRDGETLEAIQFLLNRLLQARDKNAEKVIRDDGFTEREPAVSVDECLADDAPVREAGNGVDRA